MSIAEHRTVPELFTDLIGQIVSLFRAETRLARAEMSEKITQATVGIGLLVAGAVLLIPALVVLLEAAVAALIDAGYKSSIASLIVGGAALVVGIILALIGASRLRPRNLAPRRTIEQLHSDTAVARQQFKQQVR